MRKLEVGMKAITTVDLENMSNFVKAGTTVTIADIGCRGYDLVTEDGIRITETGFCSIKPIE